MRRWLTPRGSCFRRLRVRIGAIQGRNFFPTPSPPKKTGRTENTAVRFLRRLKKRRVEVFKKDQDRLSIKTNLELDPRQNQKTT
jgi:hypothetical protein